MGCCQVTATKQLSFLLVAQLLGVVPDQLTPILLKPDSQPLPLLRGKLQNSTLKLLHAHMRSVSNLPIVASQISMTRARCITTSRKD
ncbi:MAG: hypothetical protein ACREFG_01885 [Chthoniobacterales bacterium]